MFYLIKIAASEVNPIFALQKLGSLQFTGGFLLLFINEFFKQL